MRPSDTKEIAIVGMHACEARELAHADAAVGLAVRVLAFGSPVADAAFAAHGPGSVRLPLTIVAGRYSLQRPAFGTVLECIEVLRRDAPDASRRMRRTGHRRPTSTATHSSRSSPENLIAFHTQLCQAQHGRGRKMVGDTRHCGRPHRQRRPWVGYLKAAAKAAPRGNRP
jgi:hypothetical protein